jgi:hypothetical protein
MLKKGEVTPLLFFGFVVSGYAKPFAESVRIPTFETD